MKTLSVITMLLLSCLLLGATESLEEAEQAYAGRSTDVTGPVADVGPITHAISLYRTVLEQDPDNLEIRWKLMRAIYFHGRFTGRSESEQQEIFASLLDVGRDGFAVIQKTYGVDHEAEPEVIAAALKNHQDALKIFFYQAVGWGQWALVYGKLKAVRKGAASKIRDYATVCYLADPAMDSAGAQRILGRLHHQTPKVPFISGWVSKKDARKYLAEAWSRGPENPMNGLFLGELLLDLKEGQEAKKVLTTVSSMAPRENYSVEDMDSIQAAKELVKGL